MKILITGAAGLIGGEAVEFFGRQGHEIVGIDNNMRQEFFGEAGSTAWNLERLKKLQIRFAPNCVDIRDAAWVNELFRACGSFDAIIHCAAQPSHDKAKDFPLTDFDVNARGTLILLEAYRHHCPEAVFIFMSTNKVYGDAPNELRFHEFESRYDYAAAWQAYGKWQGFDENTRIDQSTHSLFGCSKAAADLMVQEYGRYFGLKTTVFRGGCLTGPTHSAVELHGFLSYLVKCVLASAPYTIYGYRGKQVRDNIHSYDVCRAFEEVIKAPKKGAVYNIGGGRANSISILEAIDFIRKNSRTILRSNIRYNDTPRVGDHRCYITDLTKFETDYPNWKITRSVQDILLEIIEHENSSCNPKL